MRILCIHVVSFFGNYYNIHNQQDFDIMNIKYNEVNNNHKKNYHEFFKGWTKEEVR